MKKIYILLFFLSYSIFAQVEPQSISPVPVGCKPATVPAPLPMPVKSKKQGKIKGAAGVAAVPIPTDYIGKVESLHSAFVNWTNGGFDSFSIGTGSIPNGPNSQNIRWGQGLNTSDKSTGGYSFEELKISSAGLGSPLTKGQNFYFHLYNGGVDTVVGPLNFTFQPLGTAGNIVSVNIQTNFGTNGMSGFTSTEAANMKDFYDKVIPIIAQVYGPSSHAYTVDVVNDGNSGGTNTFWNGPNRITTQYTADASGKMTQPRLMVHEMIHAWRDNVCLSSSKVWHYDSTLSGFEESMADCVAAIVMDKFIEAYPSYYSASSTGLSQHWSHEPGYAFDWDYDFQNTPQLTNANFWASDIGMGAHWERYGMGSAAMYKMYIEDNNFFINFNAEYYRRFTTNNDLTTSRALMVDICKTVIKEVEGKPTETWVNNQRIFDCKVTPGKKVHMLTFQGAGGWQYFSHDNRIHLYETQNNTYGSEWSWDVGSGASFQRWYHQLNNLPGKIDIVKYSTGGITATQTFRNNDGGYIGPFQGGCSQPNINGPGPCFPGGIDGHSLITTSADPAITGGAINSADYYKSWGLASDRFVWKLQENGLYVYNIEFQVGAETVKGKFYRLHGNDLINKLGVYAGVRNNSDVANVKGKMYIEQKNFTTPIDGEEPAIPIDNGALVDSRKWASVLETQPQFQGGRTDTRYSNPGKLHCIYVDEDCTKPQKIGFRNIGYGSNTYGIQMLLLNVDEFDEIKFKETMPDQVCEGYDVDFSVTYDAGKDLLPVLQRYLDTDSRITYKWINPSGVVVSTDKLYTLTNAKPTDSGEYTLEITSYGCPLPPIKKVLTVTQNVVLAPTVIDPIPVCAEAILNLDVNGTLPPGTTYVWTGPNGFTSTAKNPSIANVQAINAGLYTVTCTVKNCDGVTDITVPKDIQVIVNDLPIATLSSISPICLGNDADFIITGTPGNKVSYTGFATGTETIEAGGTVHVIVSNYIDNPTLNLINVSDAKCSNDVTVTNTVIVRNTPYVNLSSNSPICSGSDAVFKLTGTTGNKITYNTGGTPTTVTIDATGKVDIIIPAVTADVTLNLTNLDDGVCSSPLLFTNVVKVSPKAAITCGTSTLNSVTFNWTPVLGATGYSVEYEINGGSRVNVGAVGNASSYTVGSLNELDNVKVFITPTGPSGTCFSVENFTCKADSSIPCTDPAVPIISTSAATCSAEGISTITNYDPANTYIFNPPFSSPTIDPSTGVINGMVLGTQYTVASKNRTCISKPTDWFRNPLMLASIEDPTITPTAASCSAAGTSTISNYDPANTYTFSPTGPTVDSTGLVSGMAVGTSYTVTSGNGGCASAAVALSNAAMLGTPAVPTIAPTAASCSSAGTSTISNYDAANTYTFSPTGPTVDSTGLVSGMTVGTPYTVTSGNGICTSVTASLSNAAMLITPAVPTIAPTAATCSAGGTSTISNYDAANTYTFSPTGPTVDSTGLISGMTVGTPYMVTSGNGGCTSASAALSNAAMLVTPAVPTIAPTAASCSSAGTSTISNYDAANTYTFSPTGPAVDSTGLVSGMTVGTSYTVTSGNGICTSATASLSNAAMLVTPAVPTITPTAASCSSAGTSTISNYDAANTYTFSPTGPTVDSTGLISGMTVGTPYTVTSGNGGCTSASAALSNAAMLVTPAVPTITATAATCSSAGTSTISNYDAANTYTFSPTGPTVDSTGLVSGMTVGTSYTVTSGNGICTSATASLSNAAMLVTPAVPTIIPGGSTAFCAGDNVILTASAGGSYLWSTGAITQSITVTTAGNYNVKVTNASGCQSLASANTIVTINTLPIVPQLSVVSQTCSGEDIDFTITGTPGNVVTYDGSVSGTITIQPNGKAIVIVTGAISDTTLRLTKVSDGTCDLSMSRNAKTVYVQAKPNAGTTGKLTVCSGSVPTEQELFSKLQGNPDKGGTWSNAGNVYTYTVKATSPCTLEATGTVTVSTQALPNAGTNGTLTICSGMTPTDAELFAQLGGTPSMGGVWAHVGDVYTYTVKGIFPCTLSATATVTVTRQAAPNAGIAGELTICSGTTPTDAELFAKLGGKPDAGGTWNKSGAKDYIYTVLPTGVCTVPATAKVLITEINPIAEAGIAKEITCKSSSVTLNGAGSSTDGYTYLWSGGTIVSGSNTLTPIVSAVGIYTLTVTNTAFGCKQSDAVEVTTNTVMPVANAGNAGVITCLSPTVKLDGAGSSTGADIAYSWTGGKIATGVYTLTPTVSAIGMYTLKVVNTVTGCSSTNTVEVIQDIETPDFSITDLGSNQFEIVATGGTEPYEYSINNANEYNTNPEFKIFSSGSYTINVKDSKGCFVSDRKYLEYIGADFPKFFSPDGDGTNDYWYPTKIEDYPNIEVLIFDRYQRLIVKFRGNNELGWDGTYQGKPLPPGDYWYVIKTNNDNDKREFIGGMTLFR